MLEWICHLRPTHPHWECLEQGSPTPGPWTSICLQPIRNQATQQEVSGRRASRASSAALHRSHYRLNHPPQPHPWKTCLPQNRSLVPKRLGTAGLEDIPFTNTLRNNLVSGVLASLKISMIAHLCKWDVTVGTAATQWKNLNAVGVIWSWRGRGQVAAFNHQRECGCGYHNGQQRQSSSQNSQIHADLWCWLVNYGVLKSEINRKPTRFSLDLYKQKSSRSSEQKSNSNHKNRVTAPWSIPRLKTVCRLRTPWMKGGVGSPWRRFPVH